MPHYVRPTNKFLHFTCALQLMSDHQINQTSTQNPNDYHMRGPVFQAFNVLHSEHKTIPELTSALQ